ncbi:MAG: hypothetical protein ACK4RK_05740 [Gemmataceae bacterium]
MSWIRSLTRGFRKAWQLEPKRRSHCGNRVCLAVEQLESRTMLDASASLVGGVLSIMGGPGDDRIHLNLDAMRRELVLLDGGREVGRFASDGVNQINIDAGDGFNVVRIANDVRQPATISGGVGTNIFYAGGGPTTLTGGTGNNKLIAGSGPTTLIGGDGVNHLHGGPAVNTFTAGAGSNLLYNVKEGDPFVAGPEDRIVFQPGPPAPAPIEVLEATEVEQLLARAAAASASNDAIIAIVDRGGNVLGVRVEGGVSPAITGSPETLSFAIDGAISKARTAAFFANNAGPLTSRTVQFISQSTITEREVNSNPNIPDLNSTLRGPGFVAPIGIGAHFPPRVPFTPMVDLFAIENTNRDSIYHPGADRIRGNIDDVLLPSRFNVPLEFVPDGKIINPPESYGLLRFDNRAAQSRGIATLPGGIPIYKNGQLVGGIGVFFPGETGFATEENSSLSTSHDPSKPDRSFEAEYIAYAAVGGIADPKFAIGELAGIPPLSGIGLPAGRIDLVGITLDIYGPRGTAGTEILVNFGRTLGIGDPNSGVNVPVNMMGDITLTGAPVPDGFLVTPHDGVGANGVFLTAADVERIISQGINQANITRAAIRLPVGGATTKMVFAITDLEGNVLGLFRMEDATVFSIDVAVAKARNVTYYANPAELQPEDMVPGIPPGVAFTNRTFRYLAGPRFPEGIDGTPPGPFSILNDGGVNPLTGLSVGPPLPASAFQSVLGYDAFNPQTNFRDPFNILNQNGIVFFPGSMPLYKQDAQGHWVLVGGLGVSGDGVDQDDVVTFAASTGYQPPLSIQVDQFFFGNVRLPFAKFNRNPQG